jgi:hypothetical protein
LLGFFFEHEDEGDVFFWNVGWLLAEYTALYTRSHWPCRSSSGYTLASHRGGRGSRPCSMWGLWWTKRHWGRSPSISVSPANHSSNFSIIIITQGWHNRPLVAAVPSGSNWTPPPLYQLIN